MFAHVSELSFAPLVCGRQQSKGRVDFRGEDDLISSEAHRKVQIQAALLDCSSADAKSNLIVSINGVVRHEIALLKPNKPHRSLIIDIPPGKVQITHQIKSGSPFLVYDMVDCDGESRSKWQGPYGLLWVDLPRNPIKCEHAIFTTLTPSHIPWLHFMAKSLYDYGDVRDACLFIFGFGFTKKEKDMLKNTYNAFVVDCTMESGHYGFYKTATLAAPYVVDAQSYLIIDTDMFVASSLKELRVMLLENPTKVHAVIDGVRRSGQSLGWDFEALYKGGRAAQSFLTSWEGKLSFSSINAGIYLGSQASLIELESTVRSFLPQSGLWEATTPFNNDNQPTYYREQLFVSLALHIQGSLKLISRSYNAMPFFADFECRFLPQYIEAHVGLEPAKVVHFTSPLMRSKFHNEIKAFQAAPQKQCLFSEVQQ